MYTVDSSPRYRYKGLLRPGSRLAYDPACRAFVPLAAALASFSRPRDMAILFRKSRSLLRPHVKTRAVRTAQAAFMCVWCVVCLW